MNNYAKKTIAVIGIAHTGLAIAEVMRDRGAQVRIYDKKAAGELADEIAIAKSFGAEVVTGTNSVDLNGVDLLVPSPGVPANLPVFDEARIRNVEIISEIELAFRLSKAPIIAITGTNGKTTTTILTGRMLQESGTETYIAGNVAAGDIRMPLILAVHKAAPQSVIVAEISTFQLEWVHKFQPKVAMLLNITSDHLDRHKSVANYAAHKARIFENQTEQDFAVVNADNPLAASVIPTLAGRVLRFSTKSEVDEGGFLRADELYIKIDGREEFICKRDEIPLIGAHNIENVLAAACGAKLLGASSDSIRNAVLKMTPVEHRLEPVATIDGVLYINNSMCTNLDAVVCSIDAIERPQIIIAGGKLKGDAQDFSPVGEAFSRRAKHVILIGADSYVLRDAAIRANFDKLSDVESMYDAVYLARTLSKPGDVVVLTPGLASFDMFDNFEHRGTTFKQIVTEMERGRT